MIADDRIVAFASRLERLQGEADAIAADISEVLKEAKDEGFDTKALKRIVAVRMKGKVAEERQYVFNLVRYGEVCGVDVGGGAPGVAARSAAQAFVDNIDDHTSVEITSGGQGVRVSKKNGRKVVEPIGGAAE